MQQQPLPLDPFGVTRIGVAIWMTTGRLCLPKEWVMTRAEQDVSTRGNRGPAGSELGGSSHFTPRELHGHEAEWAYMLARRCACHGC
jgi:hypothetical protein